MFSEERDLAVKLSRKGKGAGLGSLIASASESHLVQKPLYSESKMEWAPESRRDSVQHNPFRAAWVCRIGQPPPPWSDGCSLSKWESQHSYWIFNTLVPWYLWVNVSQDAKIWKPEFLTLWCGVRSPLHPLVLHPWNCRADSDRQVCGSVVSDSLGPHGLLCPRRFINNTGAGCHFHFRASSQPRGRICVSYTYRPGSRCLRHSTFGDTETLPTKAALPGAGGFFHTSSHPTSLVKSKRLELLSGPKV